MFKKISAPFKATPTLPSASFRKTFACPVSSTALSLFPGIPSHGEGKQNSYSISSKPNFLISSNRFDENKISLISGSNPSRKKSI